MSETKFKYYSKLDNRWFYKTIYEICSETWSNGKPKKWRQFINAKDRFGVEVYEGDTIQRYPLKLKEFGVIEARPFGWWIRWNKTNTSSYLSPEFFKVVGNIDEDKNLLTKTNN